MFTVAVCFALLALSQGASLSLSVRHKEMDCGSADALECLDWKAAGFCDNAAYAVHCAHACTDSCVEKRNEILAAVERHDAQDCGVADALECQKWARAGWCADAAYAKHCAHTCTNTCTEKRNEILKSVERAADRDCGTSDALECAKWADFGWCDTEAYKRHCLHTCTDNCLETREVASLSLPLRHKDLDCGQADALECLDWKAAGFCDNAAYAVHCAHACTDSCVEKRNEILKSVERSADHDCNVADALECEEWAKHDWCNDAAYKRHCKHTCSNECVEKREEIMKAVERHADHNNCAVADASECQKWAAFGWCGNNNYDKHCMHTCTDECL